MERLLKKLKKKFMIKAVIIGTIAIFIYSVIAVHSGMIAGSTTERVTFNAYQKEDPDGLLGEQDEEEDGGFFAGLINSIKNLIGELKEALFGSVEEYYDELDAAALLEKMKAGTIKLTKSQEATMKITNENFMYMLEKIVEYEKKGLAYKTVTVEAMVDDGGSGGGSDDEDEELELSLSTLFAPFLMTADAAPDEGGGPGIGAPSGDGGHVAEDDDEDDGPEFVDISVQVSNADYEGLAGIDWRLFYAYCIMANVGRKDFGDISAGNTLSMGSFGGSVGGSVGEETNSVLWIDGSSVWTGWSYFESGSHGFEAAGTDSGHAYGRYQFDIGYDFEEFMEFCVQHDAQKYAGFTKYITLSDPKPGRYSSPSATAPSDNSKNDNYPLLIRKGELSELWVSFCDRYGQEFYDLQTTFAYNLYYKKAEASLKKVYGIDISNRGPTLKGTVWSVAVRDGYSASKDDRKNNLRSVTNTYTEGISDYDWLMKIYPAEADRHPNQRNRWDNEQFNAAKAFFATETTVAPPQSNGDGSTASGTGGNGYGATDEERYGLYISKYTINGVMETLQMKYEYEYNAMTDTKTYYSYDEGASGGNHFEHVSEGDYSYYRPVSVFKSGQSAISRLELMMDGNSPVGVRKLFEKQKFDAFGKSLYRGYSLKYLKMLIKNAPGGERCLDQIDGWYMEAGANGTAVMKEALFGEIKPENYFVGSGSSFGGAAGVYDGSLGSAAAQMAIGLYETGQCVYTQSDYRTKPWNYDCSSFVSRIYGYLDVDIGGTNTATLMERAKENRAYYEGNGFPQDEAKPGDLVIRRTGDSGHVGIYVGDGMIVHASYCYWTNSKNLGPVVKGPKAGSKDIKLSTVAGFCGKYPSHTWFRPYKDRDTSKFVPGKTYVSSEGIVVTTQARPQQQTNGAKVPLDSSYTYADFAEIKSGNAVFYKSTAQDRKDLTVAVNAGHGTKGGESVKTWCHPDKTPKVTGGTTQAGATKAVAVSSGTSFSDGTAEKVATLKTAEYLRDELLSRGYDVLMLRDGEDVQLDNVARTVIANNNADIHISLHWDGDGLSYDKGCFYMSVPEALKGMEPVASYWQEHEALGDALIEGLSGAGFKIFDGNPMDMDLTQTSFSTIPSVDIELGNQSSKHDSGTLSNQARALADGVDIYFGN